MRLRVNVSQLAAALSVLLLAAGCQLLGVGERNLLENPGFESGREGWSWREHSPHWSDFEIVDVPVRSGHGAAHLSLHHGPEDPPRSTGIFGVVQEIPPDVVPERVGGWYRVDRWEKSDPRIHLYLQFVAIVWGDPRTPEIVNPKRPPRNLENYQLRYYLAGADRPAFQLLNGVVLLVSPELPEIGQWTHFEVSLKDDLLEYWQVVPEGHEYIRLLFEARWDRLPPGGSIAAEVTFDDLYAR